MGSVLEISRTSYKSFSPLPAPNYYVRMHSPISAHSVHFHGSIHLVPIDVLILRFSPYTCIEVWPLLLTPLNAAVATKFSERYKTTRKYGKLSVVLYRIFL